MNNNTKAKALFITHDIGNYGASRSLQLLLRNLCHYDIDLVVRKRINVKKISDEEIRSKFGPHICNIYWTYLPFDQCHISMDDYSLKYVVYSYIVLMFWKCVRRRLMNIISHGNYDFIHLNSLVLHSIICSDYPFVIHVREIFDGRSTHVLNNLNKALGVIFIDESTKEPFGNEVIRNSIILNNPIDMTATGNCEMFESSVYDLNPDKHVVFSMVGVMTEKKGTAFVISSFKKIMAVDARLIIVGCGEYNYVEHCKKMAVNDRRIIFWGEEQDIYKIYAISDYIIRGEDRQCVGRTIYEGLYSGCHVIIPGNENKHDSMFQYDLFKNSIYFYSPRSECEFVTRLYDLSVKKISKRIYRSNISEYIDSFKNFVKVL